MRAFQFFSLIMMLMAAAFTWSSVASAATKVHVLENVDSKDAKLIHDLMVEKGYIVSDKPMFTESDKTVVITKTVATEVDQPSVQVEVMKMDRTAHLPKSIYSLKVPTSDVAKALKRMPSSTEINAVQAESPLSSN